MGDSMNQFKQPLLTVLVIFATAYVLTVVGCAPAAKDLQARTSADEVATLPGEGGKPKTEIFNAVPIDPKKMPECSTAEFSKLIAWGTAVDVANEAIEEMGPEKSWKKSTNVIKITSDAKMKCDNVQPYHFAKPCKKTSSNFLKATVKGYDANRIHQRCEISRKYLAKFNVQPPKAVEPKPDVVPDSKLPPVVAPNVPDTGAISGIKTCSGDEFIKIKAWRSALDIANMNIAKLGSQANWKYETYAIDSGAAATKACEPLIAYHQTNPCQRSFTDEKTKVTQTKVYSGESLREQCQTARLYTYDYAQKSESLIVTGARLYFDASSLANQPIEVGSVDVNIGENCLVSNLTSNRVSYSAGQEVLLSTARVYPPQNSDNGGLQMFVFETEQGIKVECYGLEYPGVKTSKAEVIRLLKAKNTSLSLRYELN